MSHYILSDHIRISKSIVIQVDLYQNNEYEQERTALIFSLILNLTALIESLLSEIISNQVDSRCGNNDLAKRLINQFQGELLKDSWSGYLLKIELILGEKKSKIFNANTLKAMNYLFRLRNQISHGNRREYEKDGAVLKLLNRYRNIQEYFFEKNLILRGNGEEIHIYKASVFNHFLAESKMFFKEINDRISQPNHGYIFRKILSSINTLQSLIENDNKK